MKTRIGLLLSLALCATPILASNARIETMGGTDFYIMDNISIYRNPALITRYNGMLLGDLGVYTNEEAYSTDEDAPEFTNTDPLRPYFGGTYYISQREDMTGLYLGATFNRYDQYLDYVLPGSDRFVGTPKDARNDRWESVSFLDDVQAKIDLQAAYVLENGWALGASGYLAMQDSTDRAGRNKMTRVAKGAFGVYGEVSPNVDLDASFNIAALTLDGHSRFHNESTTMYNDISFSIDARLFAYLDDYKTFVPHIQANVINYDDDERITDFNAGFGISSRIDRGFFWAGLEGFYENDSRAVVDTASTNNHIHYGKRNEYGGKVMIGIERNMLTDWLVWRVGAQQLLSQVTYEDGDLGEYFNGIAEKDQHGKSPTISFGLGLNIEDRLYVDAVIAEDIFYTFGNIFSGNLGHISSHISAGFHF
ncbi:hypothetical protein [Chitinivibrio alkaliphilus]|uniref:Uncharacterized protein n=1 Tax=Chitinivibrio alkaliphilus ACht1 TaxID=1313304 RepID=U7D7N2_9BACT|nr:hypothetical protein [Chitinivibrio alkaliphilus]ERP31586.1 hypothetical protein CALK_1449 [Chitinivibrio alkaliphilus ACht1]